MAEYVTKDGLSKKYRNKSDRSKMTAAEISVLTGLKGNNTDKILVDNKAAARAESLGLLEDKLNFLRFFTGNVNFDVKGTKFKGKKGHQVRAGVIPLADGLTADFSPAVMKGDPKENKAKIVDNNTPPQLVFFENNGKVKRPQYLGVDVDPDSTVFSQGKISLSSRGKTHNIVIDNDTVLQYEGFELTENGLSFTGPKLLKRGEISHKLDEEVGVSDAHIGNDGLYVDALQQEKEIEEQSPLTEEAETKEEASADVEGILADQTATAAATAPAEEKTENKEEKKEENKEEEEGVDIKSIALDAFLAGGKEFLFKDDDIKGKKAEDGSDTVNYSDSSRTGSFLQKSGDAVIDKIPDILISNSALKSANKKSKGLVKDIAKLGSDVGKTYFDRLDILRSDPLEGLSGEEREEKEAELKKIVDEAAKEKSEKKQKSIEEEIKRKDETESVDASKYIVAWIDGYILGKRKLEVESDPSMIKKDDKGNEIDYSYLNQSLAERRVDYAMVALGKFLEGKYDEMEPDDAMKKKLHLRTSEGDGKAREGISGFKFGTQINILPWLYGFVSIKPTFSLNVKFDYEVKPDVNLDGGQLVQSAFKIVMDQGNQSEQRLPSKEEGDKIIDMLLASIKIDSNVSVDLIGSVKADAELGLGVGNPLLVGVEGLITGGIKLGGSGKNDSLAKLGLSHKFDLGQIAKDEAALFDTDYFGDTSIKTSMGLSLDASAAAKARVVSKILAFDKDLYEFVKVGWKLGQLKYDTEFKKEKGGRFFGFEMVSSGFSAEHIGQSLKKEDDKFGFDFVKKNSDLSQIVEILSESKQKEEDTGKLLKTIAEFEGKELKDLKVEDLMKLRDQITTEQFTLETFLAQLSGHMSAMDNNEAYQANLDKAAKLIAEHSERIGQMEFWAKEQGSDIKKGNITGLTDTLAYSRYMSLSKQDKSMDEEMKKRANSEAKEQFITRAALREYEEEEYRKTIEESGKMLVEMQKWLTECDIEDVTAPNLEFTRIYLSHSLNTLGRAYFSGIHSKIKETTNEDLLKEEFAVNHSRFLGSGIVNNLSLYVDPEEIREYERKRMKEETQKYAEYQEKIIEFMNKNQITDFDTPNPEVAKYYVETLGRTYMKKHLLEHVGIDEFINYEASYMKKKPETELKFMAYRSMMNLQKDYDAAQNEEEKLAIREQVRRKFFMAFDRKEVEKTSYRLVSSDQIIDFENTRIAGLEQKALEGVKDEKGDIDFDKLLKQLGDKSNQIIKDSTSLETLLSFEESMVNSAVGNQNNSEIQKHSYRYGTLLEAIEKAKEYSDEAEKEHFIQEVKKEYYSGVMDQKAQLVSKDKKVTKKDLKLIENKDFLDAFRAKNKDSIADYDNLNSLVTGQMAVALMDQAGGTYRERVAKIRELKKQGKDDYDIFRAYKEMGAKKFKGESKNLLDTSEMSVEGMIKYARISLQKASRANFLTCSSRKIKNALFNNFGAGTSDELLKQFKAKGHFGRWSKLVELKDDESFKALSEEEQQKHLQKFYSETLLGTSGLNSALEEEYTRIMTPNMMIKYENGRAESVAKRRGDRLKALEGKKRGDDLSEYRKLALSDGTGILELFKGLRNKVIGHRRTGFDKQANVENLLTPIAIMTYEKDQMAKATKGHADRMALLQAKDELTDAAVYEKYLKLDGGKGFFNKKRKAISAKEKEIFETKYHSGNYSYSQIMEYENAQKKKAEATVTQATNVKQQFLDRIEGMKKLLQTLKDKKESLNSLIVSRKGLV